MRYAVHSKNHQGLPETTVYEKGFDSPEEARERFEEDFPGREVIRVRPIEEQ